MNKPNKTDNNESDIVQQLGHTIPFLDHSDVLVPGIMNPMSPMWQVDGEITR